MKIPIELGALCLSLQKQLKGVLPKNDIAVLEADKKCISRLYIRGLLTEREWDGANKKLIKSIQRQIDLSRPEKSGKPRLQPK